MQQHITALEAEQTTQNTNINTNATDITALEAEQTTQNTNITTNATDITALETSQAAQDTAIAALQGEGSPLGVWNANSNSPDLTTAPTTNNDFYFVGTSGTTTINGESTWNEGDAVVAVGGQWVRVAGSSAGAMPNVFTPAGNYNASTNSPDMTVAVNRVDGTEFKTYLVDTTGTQDLGNGAEEFEAGGQITWFSATSYRYDAPFKNGNQVGTNAQRLATGTADLDAGNTWFETDTDLTYVWTGTVWTLNTNLTDTTLPELLAATPTTVLDSQVSATTLRSIVRLHEGGGNNTHVGPNAGLGTDAAAIETVAIGNNSGSTNSGDNVVVIGASAGHSNTGDLVVGVGSEAARNNTGTQVTAVGPNAGFGNSGSQVSVFGATAGNGNSGVSQTAVGFGAGMNNAGTIQVALGSAAGQDNTGDTQITIGSASGFNNSGVRQVAIGTNAGQNNTGANQTVSGFGAGAGNTGVNQVASGNSAGANNTGNQQVAIGTGAGVGNAAIRQVAIGTDAGASATGLDQILIGDDAGNTCLGNNVIAIGEGAGQNNTLSGVVILGNRDLPRFANEAAANAALPAAPALNVKGSLYLYIDLSDNTVKVRM